MRGTHVSAPRRLASSFAVLVALALASGAHAVAEPPHAADSPAHPSGRGASGGVSGGGAPLTAPAGASPVAGEEIQGSSPQGETDPLVSNGLGSPLCKGVFGAGGLSSTSSRDCATSGFVAAAAPTGDFGIDVHIDTGVLGVSSGGLLSAAQDLFVAPLWMALVWVVHALVVMLEWCFTIDLLDSPVTAGIGRGLRQTQAAFTGPWLALALSIASVLALYNGLIRRRVAETVGQAALMGVMMLGGTWVILDPSGTVGALGAWANRASLGTLAVAARGTPAGPARVLGQSMDTVFAAAIEAPWCYLEFGDVGWCRDPRRLDPRLRAAGLKIAAGELALIGCHSSLSLPLPCVGRGGAAAKDLEHSAQLLREAQSNGAIFLALPANGPARNSINEKSSLLRVLCQSSDATSCRGPTASQAQFRTGAQTMSRVGGLLLIVVGVLGMVLLLGFIALRLLSAAIFSLLYLLLAPAVVLAPALGEGGRGVFRKWVLQLLGAVVAKLLFSFLLGVVLAVLAILASLQALGWWTQWLLMSAFWWAAYLRRHQALGVAGGALGGENAAQRSLSRRVGGLLETRSGMAVARWAVQRRRAARTAGEHRELSSRAGRPPARPPSGGRARLSEHAARLLERERGEAHARLAQASAGEQAMSARRAQLGRIREQRERAAARGDTRRVAELGHRGARVEQEIDRERAVTLAARRTVEDERRMSGPHGRALALERLDERSGFLAEQAARRPAALARAAGERRDYRSLAALAGVGREDYERMDPRAQRVVRLEIDRELASWPRARPQVEGVILGAREPSPADAEHPRDRGRLDRMRPTAAAAPGRGAPRPDPQRAVVLGRAGAPRSSVMDDAREVAAGRKRQLGSDRS